MTPKDAEDLSRTMSENLRRIGSKGLHSLRNRLRRYVRPPGVADETTRTAIREDAAILAIADFLEGHPRPSFRVLDACCGLGGLAAHLATNLGGNANKVSYLGIDQDARHIAKARRSMDAKMGLEGIDYRIGEIWHLPIEWMGTLDLIVLNNTLHELPPHRFPGLFEAFNQAITADVGRVCIIDMTELPIGEPEAIAINWKLDEVVAFLAAGGFNVIPTSHPKSVGVFRVIVNRSVEVDKLAMMRELAKS